MALGEPPTDGIRIVNRRNGFIAAERAEVARSLKARVTGLIGRRSLPEGSAFIIPGCRQVHTFMMRFPIDVIFSDAGHRVVHVAERVKPFRVTRYCRSAARAIELPAGTASACETRVGDILPIEGMDK